MLTSSLLILLVTLVVAGLGLLGIAWARSGGGTARVCRGQRLFFAVLSLLAAAVLVAAWQPQRGFVYAGLAVGVLLITMLWEGPATSQPAAR